MVELLKNFGKGILYVVGFPFFLVVLAIFAVFGLIAFVFQLLKSILFFFTGHKFFPDLPEDKQLKALHAAKNERLLSAPNQSAPQMNLDALDVKKNKVTSTEPIEITPTATQPDQMIEDEIMETYKPKTSRLFGNVVDDEDNVSGVDIDFD